MLCLIVSIFLLAGSFNCSAQVFSVDGGYASYHNVPIHDWLLGSDTNGIGVREVRSGRFVFDNYNIFQFTNFANLPGANTTTIYLGKWHRTVGVSAVAIAYSTMAVLLCIAALIFFGVTVRRRKSIPDIEAGRSTALG
jgi:hypothetical protein